MAVLTKEELGNVIKEQVTEQLEARKVEITDSVKGVMKEVIEETMKQAGTNKQTPYDTGKEDPKGGYINFAEFAKDVYNAGEGMTNPSPKLKSWNEKAAVIMKDAGSPAQSVGSLQAGGALVPPEFSATALTRARERSSIMGKAMVIPMATNTIEIPYIVDFDSSQGLTAGNVKFRWVSENAAATGNQVQFKIVELRLREANCLVYISNRLMDFSPVSIQPFITTAVDSALDLALSDAWFNGTGAGQPLGIMNAECLVSCAKTSGQSADTLTYANTLQILSRFYGNNGEWWANRTIIPQLGVMTVAVGAGGSAVYIGNQNGVQTAAGQFQMGLHGSPIHYEQVVPVLGDKGDLTFCDWSQYLIGQFNGQQGLALSESAHLKFDYRQHAFQFTFYTDGQPWWPSAYTPKKGNSMSPFVTTAAR